MRRVFWLLMFMGMMFAGGCALRLSAVEASLMADADVTAEHQIGVMEDGWVIVEATIEGQGPFRLVLDTGADATVLDPGLIEQLGLEIAGKGRMTDIYGESETYPIYLAGTVRVGPVVLSGVPVIPGDRLGGLMSRLKVDGVLGYYGLDQFTLDLDYLDGVARVSTERLSPDTPGVLPLAGRWGATPVVRLHHVGFDEDQTMSVNYGIDSGGKFALSPPLDRFR